MLEELHGCTAKSVISNCLMNGRININANKIVNCYRVGGITGGISAKEEEALIEKCCSNINIIINSENGGFVGGLVGYMAAYLNSSKNDQQQLLLKESCSFGNINVNNDDTTVGGAVGSMSGSFAFGSNGLSTNKIMYAKIKDVYSHVNLNGTAKKAGRTIR